MKSNFILYLTRIEDLDSYKRNFSEEFQTYQQQINKHFEYIIANQVAEKRRLLQVEVRHS